MTGEPSAGGTGPEGADDLGARAPHPPVDPLEPVADPATAHEEAPPLLSADDPDAALGEDLAGEETVDLGQPTEDDADAFADWDDPELAALWQRFSADGDPQARERLILQYAPLVKYVAGRVSVGLPSHVEVADLTSYGMFGLIDAVERYDPARGVRFESYAIQRIRGAIIDELRSLDWIPRSVRSKARQVEEALQDLEHRLGRSPGEEELAGELGMDLDEMRRTLSQVALTSVVALDEAVGGDDEARSPLVERLPDRSSPDPEARVDDAEMRRLLATTVDELGERERSVVVLYYFEGLTLAQIGEVLGVTESRVSQIHSKSVLALRGKIAGRVRG